MGNDFMGKLILLVLISLLTGCSTCEQRMESWFKAKNDQYEHLPSELKIHSPNF
jgi:hypothetical protein